MSLLSNLSASVFHCSEFTKVSQFQWQGGLPNPPRWRPPCRQTPSPWIQTSLGCRPIFPICRSHSPWSCDLCECWEANPPSPVDRQTPVKTLPSFTGSNIVRTSQMTRDSQCSMFLPGRKLRHQLKAYENEQAHNPGTELYWMKPKWCAQKQNSLMTMNAEIWTSMLRFVLGNIILEVSTNIFILKHFIYELKQEDIFVS